MNIWTNDDGVAIKINSSGCISHRVVDVGIEDAMLSCAGNNVHPHRIEKGGVEGGELGTLC